MVHLDTLNLMDTVECCRMGLWKLLIERGQQHLAHAVLSDGFKLIEVIRASVTPLTVMKADECMLVRQAAANLYATLVKCQAIFPDNGQFEKLTSRLDVVKRVLMDRFNVHHAEPRLPIGK